MKNPRGFDRPNTVMTKSLVFLPTDVEPDLLDMTKPLLDNSNTPRGAAR